MNNSRGFFKIIGIIVVALVILSILGFRINDVLSSPVIKNFFTAIWNVVLFLIQIFTRALNFLLNTLSSLF